MNYLVTVFCVMVLLPGSYSHLYAQTPSYVGRIDTFLTNLDSDQNINANVLVAEGGKIEGGKITEERSFGWANASWHRLNRISPGTNRIKQGGHFPFHF